MPIFSTLLAIRVDETHRSCMMEWALPFVSDCHAMHIHNQFYSVDVCMCVCMCVHAHACAYMRVHICVRIHACVPVCAYMCIHVHMCAYMHAHTVACMCIHAHACCVRVLARLLSSGAAPLGLSGAPLR